MESLFNTSDNCLFLGVRTDNFLKAEKGTPQYAEWLIKFRAHRSVNSGDFFEKEGQVLKILESKGNIIRVEDEDNQVKEIDTTEDIAFLDELDKRKKEEQKQLKADQNRIIFIRNIKQERKHRKKVGETLKFNSDLKKSTPLSREKLFQFKQEGTIKDYWDRAIQLAIDERFKFSDGRETRATTSDVLRKYSYLLQKFEPELFYKIIKD